MKTSTRTYRALSTCAVVFALAACGGSQPPIGAPGSMQQTSASATHAERGKSWMLPEAKSDNLVYVVDAGTREVGVYSYPQRKRVGVLRAPENPYADCVDKSGSVWIMGEKIFEYRHGSAKPNRELAVPSSINFDPVGCAVDPRSGDLAISEEEAPFLIYPKADGPPREYGAYWQFDQDCTYTSRGGLYVVGTVGETSSVFHAALWKLNRQSNSLQRLHFRNSIDFFYSSGVQWDGEHVVWGDGDGGDTAYLYRIGKPHGSWSIVGMTKLKIEGRIQEFSIYKNLLVVPYGNSSSGAVGFFHYPRGGASFATIKGLQEPVAVTYSPASK